MLSTVPGTCTGSLATELVAVLGTFVYCTLLESSASAGKTYFTIDDISASVETEPLGLHAIRPRDLLQGFRYGGVPANDTQDQGRARADREHREQLRGSSSYKGIGWRQSLQEHQGQFYMALRATRALATCRAPNMI